MNEAAPQPDDDFETARKQATRARWALNALVGLSALASALFFAYVLTRVAPRGKAEPPEVNVPTSAVAKTVGLLQGESGGLFVELRDLDEAPSYREAWSDRLRTDLGIAAKGRLYRLLVRNDGKEKAAFAGTLSARDGSGTEWPVRWLKDVADATAGSDLGRMALAQAEPRFELAPGESRQLDVFVQSRGETLPPSAEDFASGSMALESGPLLALQHTRTQVAQK
ncbi:MAG: hypothetical protein IT463_13285 [Planctomycetes bacterium]|nr:hypothetical protein [Planctomycetota bacterium]